MYAAVFTWVHFMLVVSSFQLSLTEAPQPGCLIEVHGFFDGATAWELFPLLTRHGVQSAI